MKPPMNHYAFDDQRDRRAKYECQECEHLLSKKFGLTDSVPAAKRELESKASPKIENPSLPRFASSL